jgi:hypothetical protein
MTLEAIKEAIAGLRPTRGMLLLRGSPHKKPMIGTPKMEKDFSQGGRGVALLDKERTR